MNKYIIYDPDLIISLDRDSFHWQDSGKDHRILKSFDVSESADRVVLLDWMGRKPDSFRFNNLIRCNELGEIIWQADLPKSDTWDSYTSMQEPVENNIIFAYSMSGFSVEIDVYTGKIMGSIFVK